MFTETDLTQIKSKGINLQDVEKQINYFKQGFPYLKLAKIASLNDGILPLEKSDISRLTEIYHEGKSNKKLLKFVPASGAASRMFKKLFSFMENYTGSKEEIKSMEEESGLQSVNYLFKNLNKFAFYDDLKDIFARQNHNLKELLEKRDYKKILEALLTEKGLNYGNLPKGLLKFHQYPDTSRTPVEEHLVEGAHYCQNNEGKVYLHFTVSPEHRAAFKDHIEAVQTEYEEKFRVQYVITFSEQKPATDTIAVDLNDQPFREPDGSLLFRPGGHGALLENLNDMDTDVVFIKNIDNVVPDRLKEDTYAYKKALCGILFDYQDKIFNYLEQLKSNNINKKVLNEIDGFMKDELCVLPPDDYNSWTDDRKVEFIVKKLDRPSRVCGMVENVGEPGGGPFWVHNQDGSISLQIVETSQMNLDDPQQKKLLEESTHFSPTDLVCGLKNYKGEKFNLLNYRDPDTGFISRKSKDGKELKALELPGLWNGSMANWNTIFVEVPIITFNPVKTINDLLRDEHLK